KKSTLETTAGRPNISTLPDYANVSSLSYGLGFHYEQLDYRLNPRNGYILETVASTGTRTISKIKELPDSLYNNLQLKTTEYHAALSLDYFIPLSVRHVIDLG